VQRHRGDRVEPAGGVGSHAGGGGGAGVKGAVHWLVLRPLGTSNEFCRPCRGFARFGAIPGAHAHKR
jgi:hypothetical protein